MSSNPPPPPPPRRPTQEQPVEPASNTPPPLPPPRRVDVGHSDRRSRVHAMHHFDQKEICALREVIDRRIGDSDQQKMDAVFAEFVDCLRETQVAGMSEHDVLKMLDQPVRFSGKQFIDWAMQSKLASGAKPSEHSMKAEASSAPASPPTSRDRGLHEAHLLILVGSGCIQPTYHTTPPSLDCPDAIFEIEGTFHSPLHRSSLPTARACQVIVTPAGDISYGVPGTPLSAVLTQFAEAYFRQFPGRTNFMAQELASWLLEKRSEGVKTVPSTDQAIAIGKRMVLHDLIVPCQAGKVFPEVCGVAKGWGVGNLSRLSKCFKYDDTRYFVNAVALYGKDSGGDSNAGRSRHESTATRSGNVGEGNLCKSRSYTVIVRTGKATGGGTSGPVYITLFSHLGCTSEQQLVSSFSDPLGRTEEHIFTVVAPDIGKITHVTLRLSAAADPWNLHTLVVCDESFSENSVFFYKDWLKPTYLSVTLGSQGSFSPNGSFVPNSVLSQSSSFALTCTKFEKLAIPVGFSKLLVKFDDQEVGYLDLQQYQAPFAEPTVIPLVECNLSLPSCLISAAHAHEDEGENKRIELFVCRREHGNPQLQTQFIAMGDFWSQMISMTGMHKGSVALQLKSIEDRSSVNLAPSTISIAFQEKQDDSSSAGRPAAAAWTLPPEYVVLSVQGVQVMCGHLGAFHANLIITNFRARVQMLNDTSSSAASHATAAAPLTIDLPLAFVRVASCQSFEGLHRVKLKTFDDTFKMELMLTDSVGDFMLKQWGLSISRHIVNLLLLGSRPPWKFVADNALCYRASGGCFPPTLSSQESEFQRFGIVGAQSYWRETHANSMSLHRDICPTYPSVLAVPSSISDQVVKGAALFRSSGRFPCLSWAPPTGQATRASYGFICRSSQPNVGVFDNTSSDDEKIIKAMTDVKGRLIIFDCRPEINATANKAKGKGSVKSILSNYPGVLLEFLDIENIHCVRDAHTKLAKACSTIKGEVGDFDDKNFWSSVADSKWLHYLSDIICGSLKVVRNVAAGTGALVHCSDGWDRTPQITSLSSVILDPYYRTAHGFFVLIEKEWCNMGHKFADRLNNSIKSDQEESPVFLQWLDCVWQLWRQCPPAFEFNDVMLLHLADQVYCGRWSHFAHNCQGDLEREGELALRLSGLTGPPASPPSFASAFLDLTSHVQQPAGNLSGLELKQQFRNDKYAPSLCDGVILVSGQQRSLQVWPYHFRWLSSSLRTHLHPHFVTAELPQPCYLMSVSAASATHSDALEYLNQMLPVSPTALAHEDGGMLGEEWLHETTSNGTDFWRHKVSNEVKWGIPSGKDGSSSSAITWQNDADSDCCSICLSKFTTILNRRHHCRVCGRLVCKACSPRKLHGQRACKQCHDQELRAQAGQK